MKSSVPELRIRLLNDQTIRRDGSVVLYWMTANRRPTYNFALDRALDWCEELGKPLLILEAIRLRYEWASHRMHRFVMDGMIDNQNAFADKPCRYYPYVERSFGDGSGLLAELAKQSCVIVSDDFPCFFHPTLYAKIAKKLPVKFELVDSNGLMPIRAGTQTFTVAHSYRRFMQKTLPNHLQDAPSTNPFKGRKLPRALELDKAITKKWPEVKDQELQSETFLANLPIDRSVKPSFMRGGHNEAAKLLDTFIKRKLTDYMVDRNEPDEEGSSSLSPYLHFGHISAHEIFQRLMKAESWDESKLQKPNGKMNGFWSISESSEAFLDQLVTWREIGFNMCSRESNYDRYESLPSWAKKTLAEHAKDHRPELYTLDEFEHSQTADPLWNAAQRQLVQEGRMHNYLRMLWGKKILQWTTSPVQALEIMIHLNNKYALDGRDPNSYSGIFWVLGRYDRAWGPERPIFGNIRYMTSESTARKWNVKKYLARYS